MSPDNITGFIIVRFIIHTNELHYLNHYHTTIHIYYS